jgi:putative acyl-CoA dehydrogenase
MGTTHEVFNQVPPRVGANLYADNRPMRDALAFHGLAEDAALQALGAELGTAEMLTHARLANTHKPQLRTHGRTGERIDEVEFHPSYHTLLGAALRHGLHATPWSLGVASAHLKRAAGFMLFTELEPSVLCPVSMSYAVTPALRANVGVCADWQAGLASTRYDPRFVPFAQKTALTMGMGMTEKQGGSDVRANTTRAEADGDDAWGRRVRLTGHKWFFSAPMCDAFLVLAQAPGGLSCYFLPRWLPSWVDGGSCNAIRIQRLKDKLGNCANASSEVEFDNATAWAVGDEGRGVSQILAMGALTRLDCALGTAGLMRQALTLAIHHTRERAAFGKRLAEQPLMKNVLADLALESEAATTLALRLARAIDATELGTDAHEQVMRRVLTPVAKFWVCKRGSHFAQEAMECLGGNGYVEEHGESVMARIYREMPLNSIWEGAGNIMALDLLRALRGADVAAALVKELAPLKGADRGADRLIDGLAERIDGGTDESGARRLARDIAVLLQAALLRQHAGSAVADAFCASRFGDSNDVFGLLGGGCDVDAIIERALPH